MDIISDPNENTFVSGIAKTAIMMMLVVAGNATCYQNNKSLQKKEARPQFSKYSLDNHPDPELQAIVQGLEVSSPSFRAILGVLFCDYDVSQGLIG